jgi:hypothetical protein
MLNVGWWYNWNFDSKDAAQELKGVPYAPMIWGRKSMSDTSVKGYIKNCWFTNSALTAPVYANTNTYDKVLLAFNEPDLNLGEQTGVQANMTVAEAMKYWPTLSRISTERGIRLGSPVVATKLNSDDGWLNTFLKAIDAHNGDPLNALNKVKSPDFITMHWYQIKTTPEILLTKLLADVDLAYQRYKKPLWITEFAAADFTDFLKSKGLPMWTPAQGTSR